MCTKPEAASKTEMFVDVTPTWGEVGVLYFRLFDSKEHKAEAHLRPEIARALAIAQGFTAIEDTLTEEQAKTARDSIAREIAKLSIVCKEKG